MVVDAKSLDKWKVQCTKLGLKGQLKLVNKEDASPIPFPVMTDQQNKIYTCLLLQHDAVKDYNKQPIPMRVLSLIALAEKENYFKDIRIWSDYTAPDPLVVGTVQHGENSWNSTDYVIARWGDELDSLPQLIKKAIEKEKSKRVAQLKEKVSSCKSQLENLDSLLESHFNGNSVCWET